MNWLDIAMMGFILLSGVQGRGQGLARAILPLAGVVAGTLAAGLFYDDLAESLSELVTNDRDALIVGFLAVFAAVYFGSQMLAALAGPFAALLLLGPWTRTIGMLIGLLTGALLVDTFLIFQAAYPSLGLEDAVRGSALADVFIDSFPLMRFLLPNEFDAAAAGF